MLFFLVIGAAAYKLRAETGSSTLLVVLALVVTAFVLVAFAEDTLRNAPETFTAIIAIAVFSVILDAVLRRENPAVS